MREDPCFFGHTMQNFPNQGSNLCPPQWKHGILTTGPPGKSKILSISHCSSTQNNTYITEHQCMFDEGTSALILESEQMNPL